MCSCCVHQLICFGFLSYNYVGCPPPGVPPSFAFHRHTNKLLFAGYLLANSKLLARSGSTANNTLIASYLLFGSVSTFAPQNWPTQFWPVYCVTQPCSEAEFEKSEGTLFCTQTNLCVWPFAFHFEYKRALPPEHEGSLVARVGHRRLRGAPPVGAIRLQTCY